MQFTGSVCSYLTDTAFIESAVRSHQHKLESGRDICAVLRMARLPVVMEMVVSHGSTNALFGKRQI